MKIIDKDGRLFGKISVIDVLVIAVVIVMAAALYFKNSQVHTGTAVTEEAVTFQVRARGLNRYVADAILVGDGLYDKDKPSGGQALGRITDVEVEQDPGSKLADKLTDGTVAYLEAEGTVDLLITVEGRGVRSGGAWTLNRVYNLGINASRTYYTKRAEFSGAVSAIF